MNRPITKTFFIKNGGVKTSGGANSLADGQFGIVDTKQGTATGPAIVSTFDGKPKDDVRFAFQVGGPNVEPSRSFDNKNLSSAEFALHNVKKVRVSVPERTEITHDEVIIGYNGFDASTSLAFTKGQAYWNIALLIKDGAIMYRGGTTAEELVNVKVHIPGCDPMNTCEDCDTCDAVDCQVVVLEAIERLRNYVLSGGKKLEEFVDITPVLGECDNNPTPNLTAYYTWTLEVCDTGDAYALSAVQQQYNYPVERSNRVGSVSTYKILVSENDSNPSAYVQSIDSLLKGCADCPAGYTATEGGLLYAITIEDGGVDRSSVITAALASSKYVSGTILKNGNDAGVGNYTAIYSSAITAAEVQTFVGTTTNGRNTATVQLVGEASAFCTDSSTTTTAWTQGDSCNATTEQYTLNLRDNECGEDRLAELQAAYPGLTIAIDTDPAKRTRALTLTGSSGTATVTIGTHTYTATYASNLTTTAANFVTSHASDILADDGLVVTANGAILTFEGTTAAVGTISIANATGNLAGSLAAAVQNVPFRVNCSTQYIATVNTNLVCEECSDVFLDFYRTDAPKPYVNKAWTKVATAVNPNGNCLCGIRFKGKFFTLSPDEALRDTVGFVESATQIDVASGYTDEIREFIGYLPKGEDNKEWISRFVPRTHLYGNADLMENESRAFFKGTNYQPNYLTRVLLGQEAAVQENTRQYIAYYVEIKHESYTGGFGSQSAHGAEYEIRVELGKHAPLQTLLNDLAGNAGVPGVQA